MRTLIRKIARWNWFNCFLSEYRWYRKLHGGKWMQSHVDFPVCSTVWMNVPDSADETYREPGWRGNPIIEVFQ